MVLLQLMDLFQELFVVLHDIFSLVPIHVNAVFVADWLESKLVQPPNSRMESDGARNIWGQDGGLAEVQY